MMQFKVKTLHFNNPVDEETIRESGDFLDCEVKDILAMKLNEHMEFDGGEVVVERIA